MKRLGLALAFYTALVCTAAAQLSGCLQFPGRGTAHITGAVAVTLDPADKGAGVRLSGGNQTATFWGDRRKGQKHNHA
jgi:hypothetical protein